MPLGERGWGERHWVNAVHPYTRNVHLLDGWGARRAPLDGDRVNAFG